MAANKRIAKELAALNAELPAGITSISLVDESNIFVWQVTISGPEGSPYAGGSFHTLLTLPPTYPFKPPQLNFLTKIYHPNVSNDIPPNTGGAPPDLSTSPPKFGSVCIGLLKADEWKPSTKIEAVLNVARELLREPNPDDPLETRIAEEYRGERARFEKEAREWVKRYAGKK
ncbi:MAG: hypothetical protein Q9227_006875 [Pyrenula ochraceoflavens]